MVNIVLSSGGYDSTVLLAWCKNLWKDKKVTAVSLIKKYGMASSTFYKKVEQWESRTDSQ